MYSHPKSHDCPPSVKSQLWIAEPPVDDESSQDDSSQSASWSQEST